jgi:hypothetical protein
MGEGRVERGEGKVREWGERRTGGTADRRGERKSLPNCKILVFPAPLGSRLEVCNSSGQWTYPHIFKVNESIKCMMHENLYSAIVCVCVVY